MLVSVSHCFVFWCVTDIATSGVLLSTFHPVTVRVRSDGDLWSHRSCNISNKLQLEMDLHIWIRLYCDSVWTCVLYLKRISLDCNLLFLSPRSCWSRRPDQITRPLQDITALKLKHTELCCQVPSKVSAWNVMTAFVWVRWTCTNIDRIKKLWWKRTVGLVEKLCDVELANAWTPCHTANTSYCNTLMCVYMYMCVNASIYRAAFKVR